MALVEVTDPKSHSSQLLSCCTDTIFPIFFYLILLEKKNDERQVIKCVMLLGKGGLNINILPVSPIDLVLGYKVFLHLSLIHI